MGYTNASASRPQLGCVNIAARKLLWHSFALFSFGMAFLVHWPCFQYMYFKIYPVNRKEYSFPLKTILQWYDPLKSFSHIDHGIYTIGFTIRLVCIKVVLFTGVHEHNWLDKNVVNS